MLLNIIYHSARLGASLLLKIHFLHYFIGFGPRLFNLKLTKTLLSFGFYVPIPWLSRIYKIDNGRKTRFDYVQGFQEHPAWKRLLVVLSGIFSMLIAGVLFFITIVSLRVESYISKDEIYKYGIYPSPLAESFGFQRGDRVLAINGKNYETYNDLNDPEFFLKAGTHYTIKRDGEEIDLETSGSESFDFHEPFLAVLAPFQVASVMQASPAADADIRPGDKIVRVNEDTIVTFYDMRNAFLKDDKDYATLVIQRSVDGKTSLIEKKVALSDDKKIGITSSDNVHYTLRKYSFFQALGKGTQWAFRTIHNQLGGIASFISGTVKPARSMRGPIAISNVFGQGYLWMSFLYLCGTWAMSCSYWNLLPLPHSAFWQIIPLCYEGVTRKKISAIVLKTLRTIAFIMLGFLMLLIFIKDVSRLF